MPLDEQLDKRIVKANILPLRYWDDPVLSTVCDKIEDNEFGSKLEEFGNELIATMHHHKNALGLAAPQVGVSKQIFVMALQSRESEPLVAVNPSLVLTGSNVAGREGCLSLPGLYEQVYRSFGIVMKFFNPHGVESEIILTDILARVVQHEYDHLQGIMFFDHKDKREQYVTPENPTPRGARMSKNLYKQLMREWEKKKNGKH